MDSLLLALALLATPRVAPVLTARPPASGPAPLVGVAPALTATALRDELRARSQQRQEELAALAKQRAELEKLAAEVAAAKAALETAQHAQPKEPRSPKEKDDRPGVAQKHDVRIASTVTAPASPEALAKTVKGMKAEQAAALIMRLDRGLAVDVLRRMKPADTGAILDRMKGDTAAELFSAMAAARSGDTHAGER